MYFLYYTDKSYKVKKKRRVFLVINENIGFCYFSFFLFVNWGWIKKSSLSIYIIQNWNLAFQFCFYSLIIQILKHRYLNIFYKVKLFKKLLAYNLLFYIPGIRPWPEIVISIRTIIVNKHRGGIMEVKIVLNPPIFLGFCQGFYETNRKVFRIYSAFSFLEGLTYPFGYSAPPPR